mmetsp:Transcript_125353/g.287132  ORF Transcript_125353/g.287132 Transcript_125353/m.287132 type:complete len:810 (-) Transcript_125353:53-2482(-)
MHKVVLCLDCGPWMEGPLVRRREDLEDHLSAFVYEYTSNKQIPLSNQLLKMSKQQRSAALQTITKNILNRDGSPHARAFEAHLKRLLGTRRRLGIQALQELRETLVGAAVTVVWFRDDGMSATTGVVARSVDDFIQRFDVGGFSVDAVAEKWEANRTRAPPPLWPTLLQELPEQGADVRVVLLSGAEGTETAPRTCAAAACAMALQAEMTRTEFFLCSLSLGLVQTQRLEHLEELCAWGGGLSYQIVGPEDLHPAVEAVQAHFLSEARTRAERREFYAAKQTAGTAQLGLPAPAASRAEIARVLASVAAASSLNAMDFCTPATVVLPVLADVEFTPHRRWARSLRMWRDLRGLRDCCFGDNGGLGVELDEPSAGEGSWRVRNTHPPASALKLKNGSALVAINDGRIMRQSYKNEIAERTGPRPVVLTFRHPGPLPSPTIRDAAMALAETIVARVREGKITPLASPFPKPPAEAPSRSSGLEELGWGRCDGDWVDALPPALQEAYGTRLRGDSAVARNPSVLHEILLWCGSVADVARAARVCQLWRVVTMEGAVHPPVWTHRRWPPRRLWSRLLRQPGAVPSACRPGFWRWCCPTTVATCPHPTTAAAVADSCAVEDARGLGESLAYDGGSAAGIPLASAVCDRLSQPSGMPAGELAALLLKLEDLRSMWLLAGPSSVAWWRTMLFQFHRVFSAFRPMVYKAWHAEAAAVDKHFVFWLLTLFTEANGLSELGLLRMLDMFLFERSPKVFFRVTMAAFASAGEGPLKGKEMDEVVEKLVEGMSAGTIAEEELVDRGLRVKVTRSMLAHAGS